MSEPADVYGPPASAEPGRATPARKSYPLWVKVLIGLLIALPLGFVLVCGWSLWSFESNLPPRDAHPSTDALFSQDPAATKAELRWAAEAALENARGKLPSQGGGGRYRTLARGRLCGYDVFDEARQALKRAPTEGKLREVAIFESDGSPYRGPPQGQVQGMTWRLEASLGAQRLRFEFEWHAVSMGSSLNLLSVKVLERQK